MDNDRYSTRRTLHRAAAAYRVGSLACAVLLATGLTACAAASSDTARGDTGAARVAPTDAVIAEAPAKSVAAPADLTPVPAAPAAADPTPAQIEAPSVDEASNVFFALRSVWIDMAGQQKLRDIADRLTGNRRATVLLIGHSDGQGSRSYNLAITEARLTAVGKLLRSYGVAARQVRRNRVGSIRSAPECNDEACWRKARRVELVITP